jgi:tRNA dimethylallyltransferase
VAGLVVIAGPTASGKSALALRLAEAVRGTIINADSMQLYRGLRILTARPAPEDEARVPHRLYGVLDPEDRASAGRWLELARAAIGEALAEGRPALVVGGSGLYLHALLHGLAPVPEIPASVRNASEARLAALGGPAFHAELAARDPEMAARLRPTDRQRLIRAYEVLLGTGRSLADWHRAPQAQVGLPLPRLGIALMPPRAALYERIARRLREMVECGGLEELRTLQQGFLPADLPLMKAVAVPELLAHLAGEVDLATALERAIVRSRRYAKRQLTWLRHQLPELQRLEAFGDDVDLADILRCAGTG